MRLYVKSTKHQRIFAFLVMVMLISTATIADSYAAAVSYLDQNEECFSDICSKRVHLVRSLKANFPYYERSGKKRLITKYAWNWSKWKFEPQVLPNRKYAVTFYYDKSQINNNTDGDTSLVIFSSGGGMDSSMYQDLIWRIASKGHIVAAMDHTFIDHRVLIPRKSSPGEFDTESNKQWLRELYEEADDFYDAFLASGEIVPFDYFNLYLHLANSVFEMEAIDVKEFIKYLNNSDISTNNSDLTVNGATSTANNINLKEFIDLDSILYVGHSLGGMTATLMISGEENQYLEDRTETNPLWNPYYEDQIGAVISFDGAALNHTKYTYGDFKLNKPYFYIGSDESWNDLGTINGAYGLLMSEVVNTLLENNHGADLFGIVINDTYHNGLGDEKVKSIWGRKPDIYQINKSVKYIDRIIEAVFENDSNPLRHQTLSDAREGKISVLRFYE